MLRDTPFPGQLGLVDASAVLLGFLVAVLGESRLRWWQQQQQQRWRRCRQQQPRRRQSAPRASVELVAS